MTVYGRVWGFAITECKDAQGDIITNEAVKNALPYYEKWRDVREMHEPKPVGVATYIKLLPKGLLIGADIYDKNCWDKIQNQIFKGFSMGGVITGKRAITKLDTMTTEWQITSLTIAEISVVDQPANPETGFTAIKEAQND